MSRSTTNGDACFTMQLLCIISQEKEMFKKYMHCIFASEENMGVVGKISVSLLYFFLYLSRDNAYDGIMNKITIFVIFQKMLRIGSKIKNRLHRSSIQENSCFISSSSARASTASLPCRGAVFPKSFMRLRFVSCNRINAASATTRPSTQPVSNSERR